ncbi:MAG: ribose-phosphate diphosphokinase [Bacteroidetes bacterium]|jgi:ribose-phosphate pyrophosphokinase|nr:ribose-phosphate diphosphokinase [Bacteroidota bacterium]
MQDRYYTSYFSTPSKSSRQHEKSLTGPNGWLLFVACNSGIHLAEKVKSSYEMIYGEIEKTQMEIPLIGSDSNPITRVFSDSETCPRLPIHVAGSDVYVFQSAHNKDYGNTANENIQQLIQVVRTLKTHRANTITVVLPYLPYSRQDKPSFMKREAALASLFADQLKIAGTDICLTYHPHTSAVYGFFEPEIKLVALSGLDLFKAVFKKFYGDNDTVIVSTDAGGAKEVIYFAEKLSVNYAISSKFRKQKDSAKIIGVVGDITNKKRAIVIDDETVTANSLINTVRTLYDNYEIKEIYIALSHFKLEKENIDRLKEVHAKYGLKEVHITDTIPQNEKLLSQYPFIYQHTLAEIIAATINKLHYNESVSQIFSRL